MPIRRVESPSVGSAGTDQPIHWQKIKGKQTTPKKAEVNHVEGEFTGTVVACLTCDERTEDNFKVQPSQAQSDDDGVELVQSAESECDLSDYLTMTSQWSDEDEQVEWWHLPPSNMVSDSSTSSSLTTVTPLPTSQLSTTQRRTEKVDVDVDVEVDVESDEEEKGEGEEDVDVVRRLQEEKYKTCCCDANCSGE
ncbi:hypothetical protein TcWFU_009097 [Taenia crassiceps]|uniref:Uncharacterized protein n=1 Tax=Taenia crassiceps TaxID=6207 RepID=A0ABR4QHZ5_9CEST